MAYRFGITCSKGLSQYSYQGDSETPNLLTKYINSPIGKVAGGSGKSRVNFYRSGFGANGALEAMNIIRGAIFPVSLSPKLRQIMMSGKEQIASAGETSVLPKLLQYARKRHNKSIIYKK